MRPTVLLADHAIIENITRVFSELSFSFDAVYDSSNITCMPGKHRSALVIAGFGTNGLERAEMFISSCEKTGIRPVILTGEKDEDIRSYLKDDSFAYLNFPPSRRELEMLMQYHASIPSGHDVYFKVYRRILENLPMISIQGYNLNREVVFWNKSSEKLYGYTSDEAVGRKLEDLIIPPGLKDRVLSDVHGFMVMNKPIPSSELLLQRKDGIKVSVFSSHVMVTNYFGENELYSIDLDLSQLKRHQLIQGVINEITTAINSGGSLHQFLQSLRESLSKIINTRNFFIAMYNQADNTFSLPIFVDEKDRFRGFPAGRTLTAYMINMNKALLLNEQEINALEEQGEIDKVGSPCRQWLGIPMTSDGKVLGAIVLQSYTDDIVYDDTDMLTLQIVAEQISIAVKRKASQEALEESDRTLKTLISNLPGVAYRCRFDKFWTMEFLSDGFTLLTGYPVDDCIENKTISYFDLVHPDDRQEIWEEVQNAVSRNEPYYLVFRIIAKGGAVKWVWEKGQAILNEDGQVIALEGFIIDITDRIEMENQLISAKEKAEESDRLKSSFLANLSHEIRSPMNSIIGFSHLMKTENVAEPVAHYADIVYQSSCQLLSIIDNIIDQARIDSGTMSVRKNAFQPGSLMNNLKNYALEQLLLYDDKQITVSVCPGQDVDGIMISSDESLICLLMKHLVNNAVKFTKKGEIEIGCDSANDNMITFWVSDSGEGVSPLHQEIIFERFRQVDEMITRSFNGAGLGLSIAKGIAGLLGGDLRIESTKGEGAGFYFTLPVK